MNRIKSFFILVLLVFLTSCDNVKNFYQVNEKSLQKLADKSYTQFSDKAVACCLSDDCFDISTINLMTNLGIECIRKDTTEGTLNFILKQKYVLKSIELTYKYDTVFDDPKSFPKAGEEVEKISERWFVRRIFMD